MRTNLNPDAWGPATWTTLYAFARGFPEKNPSHQERTQYKNLVTSLRYLLPCASCRINVQHELKQLPVWEHTVSKQSLIKWLVQLRNNVAKRLEQPEISIDQADRYFFRYYIDSHRPGDSSIDDPNHSRNPNEIEHHDYGIQSSIESLRNSWGTCSLQWILCGVMFVMLIVALIVCVIRGRKK